MDKMTDEAARFLLHRCIELRLQITRTIDECAELNEIQKTILSALTKADEPAFTWKEEDGVEVCYMGLLPVGWASESKFCVFYSGGWDKTNCIDLSISKTRVEGFACGRWRKAHGQND